MAGLDSHPATGSGRNDSPLSESDRRQLDNHNEPISLLSEVADVGRGLWHGGAEDLYNGPTQFINHTFGTSIPELHLVDDQSSTRSVGGMIGTGVGKAFDFMALAYATGSLGGNAGATSSAMRMGALGFAYGGIFQPSDPNSENFFTDRLKAGTVDAATFGTMAYAAGYLNSTGQFAMPAVRSLMGSVAYGGLTGMAGGAAHAEASALTNGNLLPTADQLLSDTVTYTAFGAAMGGAGYGYNKLTLPEAETIKSGDSSVTVQTDQSGNLVQVQQNIKTPAEGVDTTFNWKSTMMTNGKWSDTMSAQQGDLHYPSSAVKIPGLQDVVRESNGGITTVDQDGVHRTYNPNGNYESDLTNAAEAKKLGLPGAEKTPDGWVYRDNDGNVKIRTQFGDGGSRTYDSNNRLVGATVDGKPGGLRYAGTAIGRGDDGTVNSLAFNRPGSYSVSMTSNEPGAWQIETDNQIYSWKGNVNVVPGVNGGQETLQFVPQGETAKSFAVAGSGNEVMDLLSQSSKLLRGGTGYSFVEVNDSGKATLTGGSNVYQQSLVNGTVIKPDEQVVLNPGDKVSVRADVGDRYPQFKTTSFDWLKDLKGNDNMGGNLIKPGTAFDLKYDAKIPESVAQVQPVAAGESPTLSTITLNQDGQLVLHGGSTVPVTVDGNAVGADNSVIIKPGSVIELEKDFGDNWPDWQSIKLSWAKTVDGHFALNGQAIKPGEPLAISIVKP